MNVEEIDKGNNLKEQKEIVEELSEICRYKNFIILNSCYNEEIQMFIKKIVDKYRNKWQVQNYYNAEKDNINSNQYTILCTLETMISQYAVLKFGEEFLRKNN